MHLIIALSLTRLVGCSGIGHESIFPKAIKNTRSKQLSGCISEQCIAMCMLPLSPHLTNTNIRGCSKNILVVHCRFWVQKIDFYRLTARNVTYFKTIFDDK